MNVFNQSPCAIVARKSRGIRALSDIEGKTVGVAENDLLERVRTVISDNILTGEVRRDGIGGIDPARLERSIEEIAPDFKFHRRPSASDIFDGSFCLRLAAG